LYPCEYCRETSTSSLLVLEPLFPKLALTPLPCKRLELASAVIFISVLNAFDDDVTEPTLVELE
jgi:hypothetical protein